jgi:hypothetical protein
VGGATVWSEKATAAMSTRLAGSYAAVAAGLYRRFHRQIKSHPRHRVKLALFQETRLAFEKVPPADEASQIKAIASAVLALTWLRKASADPLSTEGELMYKLMGVRDSVLRRKRAEGLKLQKAKLRLSSGTGRAESWLLRKHYGPLHELIGVKGVGGEEWA